MRTVAHVEVILKRRYGKTRLDKLVTCLLNFKVNELEDEDIDIISD